MTLTGAFWGGLMLLSLLIGSAYSTHDFGIPDIHIPLERKRVSSAKYTYHQCFQPY